MRSSPMCFMLRIAFAMLAVVIYGSEAVAQTVCFKARDPNDRRIPDDLKVLQGELVSGGRVQESIVLRIRRRGESEGEGININISNYEVCQKPFALCRDGQPPIEGDIIGKSGDIVTIDTGVVEQSVNIKNAKVCPPRDCANNPRKPGCAAPSPIQAPSSPSEVEEVVFAGSATVGEGPLPLLINAYAKANGATADTVKQSDGVIGYSIKRPTEKVPSLKIVVKSMGSNTALPELEADTNKKTIGMSSVDLLGIPASDAPNAERRKQIALANLRRLQTMSGKSSRENFETVLALDGVILLTNPDNPVRSLKICEAAKIFAGEITGWSQVPGGKAGKIAVFTRNKKSGTYDTFKELVLATCSKDDFGPSATARDNPEAAFHDIERDRDAIGFMGAAIVPPAVKALSVTGDCGIESKGSRYQIKTEDYPLSRRLFLYTPYELGPRAQDFFNYVRTDAAQAVLAAPSSASVDQTIERPAGEDLAKNQERISQGHPAVPQEKDDLRDLAQRTKAMTRLSITYRFETNGVILDAKGLQDIKRLVSYFYANPTSGNILIAGFADSRGPYNENKALSKGRAEAVKQALLAAKITIPQTRINALGFGTVAPVACNSSTYLELSRNRRAEVWIASK